MGYGVYSYVAAKYMKTIIQEPKRGDESINLGLLFYM